MNVAERENGLVGCESGGGKVSLHEGKVGDGLVGSDVGEGLERFESQFAVLGHAFRNVKKLTPWC